MAEYGHQMTETYAAAADLTAKPYHIMRFVAAGTPPTTNIASNAAAAFAVGIVGVLQNAPNTGQAATVAYLGRSKVVAGGTATAGQLWTTNSSGRAANATSGDLVIGRGLATAAADGDVVSVQLIPPVRLSGAV